MQNVKMQKLPKDWNQLEENGLPAYCSCQPTKDLWEKPKAFSTCLPNSFKKRIARGNSILVLFSSLLLIASVTIPKKSEGKILSVGISLLLSSTLLRPQTTKHLQSVTIITCYWPKENKDKAPLSKETLRKLYEIGNQNPKEGLQFPKLVYKIDEAWEEIQINDNKGRILFRKFNNRVKKPKELFAEFQGESWLLEKELID